MRVFCIECEKKVSTRRCLDCNDRYCDRCYDKIHKRGRKKEHSWLPTSSLIDLSASQRLAVENKSRGGESSQTTQQVEAPTVVPEFQIVPMYEEVYDEVPLLESTGGEWDLFFDDSAQSNYWFNNVTGEASWINPYPQPTPMSSM